MTTSNFTTITAVSPLITFRPRHGRLPALELHKTFLAVVEQGSENKAADALYMNQSTVNHRLRLLERRLGVTLFARQPGRPLELTAVGAQVLEKLQAVLAEGRLAIPIRVLAYPKCGHVRVEAVDNPHLAFVAAGAVVKETAVFVCWTCFRRWGRLRTLEHGDCFEPPRRGR